jgi:hypothetical protein
MPPAPRATGPGDLGSFADVEPCLCWRKVLRVNDMESIEVGFVRRFRSGFSRLVGGRWGVTRIPGAGPRPAPDEASRHRRC